MRILHVNKYGSMRSGADRYFLRAAEELAARGHTVAVLCANPVDVPASLPFYDVPPIDFHEAASTADRLRAASNVLWSNAAGEAMKGAIEDFEPEVVHYHNYAHQLSNSVLQPVPADVATFYTAHDYKLVCPAYIAQRDGQPCFRCSEGTVLHCVSGSCLHGSKSWSALAALEAIVTRRRSLVPETLIAPSRYMAEQLQNSWLADTSSRVVHLTNPVDPPAQAPSNPPSGDTGIYVGRLSSEKGLPLAVEAAARSGVRLLLVGEGPERAALEELAFNRGAPVEFTGYLSGAELERTWREASFFILPSTWPENAPLSILEAMVRGKAVVATDVGGQPEVVRRFGGRVVASGDSAALAEAFRAAAAGEVPVTDRNEVLAEHGWPNHLERLERIYLGAFDAN